MTRPGYGEPHPDVAAFLSGREPNDVRPVTWGTGFRFTVSAYLTAAVPPVLVGSARCIVHEGDRVVVCSTPDGPDITPGGRCEQTETYAETACREVYEEVGRSIDPEMLHYLGFVHYRHRDPMPDDFPYPYPDFFQVIYTATVESDQSGRTDGWVDIAEDGWVSGHWMATIEELDQLPITETERLFLERSRHL